MVQYVTGLLRMHGEATLTVVREISFVNLATIVRKSLHTSVTRATCHSYVVAFQLLIRHLAQQDQTQFPHSPLIRSPWKILLRWMSNPPVTDFQNSWKGFSLCEISSLLLCHISTNTGRFIMFSVITNIYNKKTKGPTLMELFTATEKLKKFDN